MMKYKGYQGRVTDVDEDKSILTGTVIGIADTIVFEGKTAEELLASFHAAVDGYLAFCQEREEEPDKPFSGRLVVRVSPQLHRELVCAARQENVALDAWVVQALRAQLARSSTRQHQAASQLGAG